MPFANASLSEDLHLVNRALGACFRFLPLARSPPIVYTRHQSVRNTWPAHTLDRYLLGQPTQPPPFVSAALIEAYAAAEADSLRRGRCRVLAPHPPPELRAALSTRTYPYNPSRCCSRGRRMPRPCPDRNGSCGDSFCSGKGTCTSSCTCPGEGDHGQPGRAPCGTLCCRYWQKFWERNAARNCSSPHRRPLKQVYCAGGLPAFLTGRLRRGAGRLRRLRMK